MPSALHIESRSKALSCDEQVATVDQWIPVDVDCDRPDSNDAGHLVSDTHNAVNGKYISVHASSW